MSRRLLLFCLFSFIALSPSLRAEGNALRQEVDQWLRKMGFEDYSSQIKEEKTKPTRDRLSPVSEKVMDFQIDRYQLINDARDLSTWIYEKTKDRLPQDTSFQNQVANLVARSMVLQPQELPEEWPSNVKTDAEKERFLRNFVGKQIINATGRVTNDLIKTAYGTERVKAILQNPESNEFKEFTKDLNYVRERVLSYVSGIQMDSEIGQSGFLGDALALTFVRDSRIREGKNGSLENKIREEVKKHGDHLENAISNEPVFKDSKGNDTKVKIKDGSLVYEYSQGKEAAEIAFGGRPSIKGTIKAATKGLLGHLPNSFIQWDESNPPNPKTWGGRFREWLANRSFANTGVSHVGQSFVNSDPSLDLHHVKVMDMYPDAKFGSSRVTTPRSFALSGPYRRLVVSEQDPQALAREFLKQTENLKNPQTGWSSNLTTLQGEDVGEKREVKEWPSLYSMEEIQAWRKLAQENPEGFAELYAERAKKGWEFMRNQGADFDYGFTNRMGAAYCSKGCVLVPKMTMGLDIEPSQSRWAFPLPLITKITKKGLDPVRREGRFVAPVSLAVQPITGKTQTIEFPDMDAVERRLARTEPFTVHSDPELRTLLQTIPWQLGEGTKDTFLSELLKEVEENVAQRRFAIDKFGPSKVFAGSYASRARNGNRSKPNTDTHDGQFKSYNEDIGNKTIQSHTTQATKEKEVSDFLAKMGLDHYSDEMEKNLKDGNFKNKLNEITLKDNVERYKMVDNARDLASHIVSRAIPNLDNEAFKERFLSFAADLLTVKPEAAVREVPYAIRNIPDIKERGEAIEKYFEAAERHRGRMQLERLVSDYLNTFYGEKFVAKHLGPDSKESNEKQALEKDISKVTDLFADYLLKIHLDPHIGATQWLGRGVALGIAQHARLNKDADLENSFKKEVEKRELYLENFISNEMKMKNSEGKIESIKVNTGDFAYGRGTAAESAVITSAAVPKDRKGAKKERLNGNLLGFFLPVEENRMTDGMSPIERLRYGLSAIRPGNPGFSHVGTVGVKTDPQTGLSSTLIWDNYPHTDTEKLAGIRISGFENFGNEEHYGFVGIASIDEKKLHQFAQEMLQKVEKEGWQPVVWRAFKPKVDKNGKVIPDANPEPGNWEVLISEDEFKQMHSEKDPSRWAEVWRKKLSDSWRKMMAEGTYFSWVDNGAGKVEIKGADGTIKEIYTPGKYYEGGTYCSQGCHLASVTATGIPMEKPGNEGGYAPFVKVLSKLLPIPAVKAIDTNERILPPSSLAMQPWIARHGKDKSRVQRVQYPIASMADRIKAEEAPPGVEKSLRITTLLRNSDSFNSVVNEKAKAHMDPRDRANAIHAAMVKTALRAISQGSTVQEAIGMDPYKLKEMKAEAKTPPESTKSKSETRDNFLRRCQNGLAKMASSLLK